MQKSPVIPLVLIGNELQSNLSTIFKKINLNIIDAVVLVSIFFEDRFCKPSEIARSLEISRSQVSQSLKRLENAGLIERSLSKSDSRVLNLKITSIGKTKSLKVIKVFDEMTFKIESVLGEKFSESMALKLLGLKKSIFQERQK